MKQLISFENLTAFTLAEVLIALTVIGVIAAITIPNIISKINDMQYQSAFKKEVSILSQAYQLIANENGGSFINGFSGCTDNLTTGNTCMKDVFKTKLKYIKECAYNANIGICFPARTDIKYLNGTVISGSWAVSDPTAGLILADGTSLAFYYHNYSSSDYGWVTMDINGFKDPNIWGKDIYLLEFWSTGVGPHSGNEDSDSDDCGTGTNKGQTCAKKYLSGIN